MKRLIVFFLVLFVSVGFISAADVTLGFGWRVSDQGLVLGEQPMPYTIEWNEEFMYNDVLWRYNDKIDAVLVERISSIYRKGYFVFGVDFNLYKGWTLGFELNAGFISREFEVIRTSEIYGDGLVAIVDGVEYYNHYKGVTSYLQSGKIIPVNFFLATKYKFDCVKKATGFLRPYLGVGAGLNLSIFIGDWVPTLGGGFAEKGFAYSETVIAMVGMDLFFSKSVGIFVEGRYIKPLKDGLNFREQVVLVAGFRFT